jgi:hypothetical protein
LPLTVPAGTDRYETVEGSNPVGNTSVTVTLSAALPLTLNVKSYRTISPDFGFVGRPVFTKLITAMGVDVEVEVSVKVTVTVGVQVAVKVFVGVSVQMGVLVFVLVEVLVGV